MGKGFVFFRSTNGSSAAAQRTEASTSLEQMGFD